MILYPIHNGQNEDVVNLYSMIYSKDKNDIKLAKQIESEFNIHKIHSLMYIDKQTIQLLELCTPYYEYIGIRAFTPDQISKGNTWGVNFSAFGQPWILNKDDKSLNGKDGRLNGWPAIWGLCDKVGFKSSCGNEHQRQINQQGTTGLYQCIDSKWFKHIIL